MENVDLFEIVSLVHNRDFTPSYCHFHITILCAKPHFISIFFNKYRHLGMRVAFIVIEVKCDKVGGTQIVATKIL